MFGNIGYLQESVGGLQDMTQYSKNMTDNLLFVKGQSKWFNDLVFSEDYKKKFG